MGRIGTAFGAFFKALFDGKAAERIQSAMSGETPKLEAPKPAAAAPAPVAPKKEEPKRSEGLTLLASLQREARLVDFLMESIDDYTDAQVGAAVRDVHRESRKVIDRCFQIVPLRSEGEGGAIAVPAGFDSQQIQLVGKLNGEPPFRGSLLHHGWKAQKVDLPVWTGKAEAALVVSPAEVEVK